MEVACFNCKHRRVTRSPYKERRYLCNALRGRRSPVTGNAGMRVCDSAHNSPECRAAFKPHLIARLKEVFA